MRFEAVIFDMDGTLTVPALDFVAVRREIGLPSGDIITELAKWSEERRRDAWEVIERHESEAMGSAKLQEGCIELLKKLRRNGVKTAILTRNSRKSVDLLIAKTGLRFDSALTREHDHVKPSPAPVTHILRELNAPPSSALMVGDYIHDLESGAGAGTATCFFQNPGARSFAEFADFTVHSHAELDEIIFWGGERTSTLK